MSEADRLSLNVGDLMSPDLVALIPDDTVVRARDLMVVLQIHALPVVNGAEVLGIVTSSDLIDEPPPRERVTAIMTPAPTTIDAAASLAEAADVMTSHGIHHLLVSDGAELVGILSSLDLLAALSSDPNGSLR